MAEIVYLPRYESERKELKGIKNIWIPEKAVIAYNLLPAIDLVVGSGGTICRESALFGIPTMSFHFWDVIAEYLDKKGFPMHYSTKMETILSWAKNALKRPDEYKADAVRLLSTLESPINLTVKYLRKCLSMKL
jgi:predicted glycosyltransferase